VITIAEVKRSLEGAWGMLLGRTDVMRFFDTSSEGFWRSFQAIILITPIYGVIAVADWRASVGAAAPGSGPPFGADAFWASRFGLLVLDWVTLPILLAGLSGFIGIRQRYPAFIVARNWSAVLAIAPFGAVAFLDLLGLLPGDVIVVPSLVALAVALRISYMVARRALNVPIEVAIGFVLFDFLVSLALARIVGRISGVEIVQ
jgi:hypothetical protein